MDEVELKKCPFCGGNVIARFLNAPFLFFKCQNHKCGAVVSFDNMTANKVPEKALENWNRRKDGEQDATD